MDSFQRKQAKMISRLNVYLVMQGVTLTRGKPTMQVLSARPVRTGIISLLSFKNSSYIYLAQQLSGFYIAEKREEYKVDTKEAEFEFRNNLFWVIQTFTITFTCLAFFLELICQSKVLIPELIPTLPHNKQYPLTWQTRMV